MKKQSMDYKLWIGFCEYILEKTGRLTKEYADTASLKRELKRCKHDSRVPNSYWRLLAKVLFTQFKINDDRLDFGSTLRKIKYTVENKEYTTKVLYVINGVEKFPAESRMTLNEHGEDEEEFIKRTMKRLIKKYPECDTDKVFSFQNYINVVVNE